MKSVIRYFDFFNSPVMLLFHDVHRDARGHFMEIYNSEDWIKENIYDGNFVQDNYSLSKHKYTVRGLHFQNNPHAHTKVVKCLSGKIFDVVVDVRKNSPSYMAHLSFIIDNPFVSLFIPPGFAHGFMTLCDNTVVTYKLDKHYNPDFDRSIRWNDKTLNIRWPNTENFDVILSEKDKNAPFLRDSDCNL